MCGIFGVLAPRGELADSLARMDRALSHRGPDGAGTDLAPGAALGHRRLAIIDLSGAAAQPMRSADGRGEISFNGEIYNFRELRRECEAAGQGFRSASDTEAILGQWRLHGERAFGRLEGIFAFALHDRESGESWLVRDPMGVKPLFWAETASGVLFASELGAVLRSGLVPFEVDRTGLAALLRSDAVPAPLTIVRGVRKLPAGHFVRVARDGRASVHPFASELPEGETPRRPGASLAEDEATFERLLGSAVRRQLVADVPVGVFLSGGLDSSLVAAAAAEATGGAIEAFSVGFDDPTFDESPVAAEVARRLGLRLEREILGPAAMLELFPRLPELSGGEPIADGSLFPTFLLSRFARRRVTVALSGDGGDELFGGYPTHAVAGWAGIPSHLPRPLRRALAAAAHRLLPVDHANLSFDFRLKKLLDGLDPDPLRRNARWLGSFAPEELPGLLVDPDPAAEGVLDAILHEVAGSSPLERILAADRRFYLGDQVLAKVDRASMRVGLEVRVPMLDGALVRFAASLPADRKVRGLGTKRLLRRVAERRFGPEVARRPKKGFGVPLARWFRSELRELVRDTLSPSRLAADGFFRPEAVARLLDEHERGVRDHRKRIFALLAFQLWLGRARGAVAGEEP